MEPGAEYGDDFEDDDAGACWARAGMRVHALFDDDEAWYAGRIKFDHTYIPEQKSPELFT